MVARSAIYAAIALTCLLTPTLATAELGRGTASVRDDASSMKGTLASHPVGPATRHDITRVNGGSVREFTNANGQVFAVTWSGPGKPDLRSLLGPYFTALQVAQASQGRMMHSLRRPAAVNQKDLKIEMSGYMGWFHGMAYVPSLTPSGFSLDELDPTR